MNMKDLSFTAILISISLLCIVKIIEFRNRNDSDSDSDSDSDCDSEHNYDSFVSTGPVACTYTNASFNNGVCYSCPVGFIFNSSLQCTGTPNASLTVKCNDPSSVLSNNTCLGCPPGQRFDKSTNKCEEIAPTSTPMYTCLQDRDYLIDKTCYNCADKNGSLNPKTMMCENIKNAYMSTTYDTTEESKCKEGYSRKNNTCYKCNANDVYVNGMCETIDTKKPAFSYPAKTNNVLFPFI